MEFKNIHHLLDAACEKKVNEDLCKSIYYSMKAIKYAKQLDKVQAGVLVGAASTTIGFCENWTHDEHMSVIDSILVTIARKDN